MPKVTILDVARYANVSQGTVSRALGNKGYVKKATREKIEEAVKALNYIPDRSGKILKTKCTGLIMLAVPDITNSIYDGMIEQVYKTAQEYGWSMVLFFTEGTLKGELAAVRMLQEHLVDGLFLVNFSYDAQLREEIERSRAPVVLCGMCTSLWKDEKDKSFSTISIDVYRGIYNMTRHMIDRGYKKIGYLAGTAGKPPVYGQRYQAFCDAMNDCGLSIDENNVFWKDYTIAHGQNSAKQLLARPREEWPEAIVASNDWQALGFWKECHAQGVKVPEDIALSGMDNLEEMHLIQLDTMYIHEDKVGRIGAEIILRQLNAGDDEVKNEDVIFEPELVLY